MFQEILLDGQLIKLQLLNQEHPLIIELPETIKVDKDKSLVLHANTETQTQRTVFPAIHDGRSRIIINKEDPLFALLQDHDVEIDIQ